MNGEVEEETCGTKFILGTFHPEDNWLDGNEMYVSLDGSQHLETVIAEITQTPSGRNMLSESVRKRAKKKQHLEKVAKEVTETPLWNEMTFEELDGTKHILQFESCLHMA